jgi:hypothetical protein
VRPRRFVRGFLTATRRPSDSRMGPSRASGNWLNRTGSSTVIHCRHMGSPGCLLRVTSRRRR